MACPTCGHTMQAVGEPDGAGQRFWCSRCGTLRTIGRYGGDDVTKLVERCREFEKTELFAPDWTTAKAWKSLGIAESINAPAPLLDDDGPDDSDRHGY